MLVIRCKKLGLLHCNIFTGDVFSHSSRTTTKHGLFANVRKLSFQKVTINCQELGPIVREFRVCGQQIPTTFLLKRFFRNNGYITHLPTNSLVFNNKSIENKYRHYSQGTHKNYSFSSSVKWILIASAAGSAGVFAYKVYTNENVASCDVPSEKEPSVLPSLKFPPTSDVIPDNVPYLLIGGGTTAFSAFRAIKAFDPTARVLIVTDQPFFPYMRAPLTKELIYSQDPDAAQKFIFKQWDSSEKSIFFEPDEFYLPCEELHKSESGGISVARGWKVIQLNPDNKYVVLDDGKRINYKKCLLATGAMPVNVPIFLNCDSSIQNKVTVYRTLSDFIALENAIQKGAKSVMVIGGGVKESELACSLARRGLQVSQMYKEGSNMAKILPEYLSNWLTSEIEMQGVSLFRNSEIEHVELIGNKLKITTKNNDTVLVDHVLIAEGSVANTELAAGAHLEIDHNLGGYLVNAELEARSGLFAAGNCASFYDQKLGRRRLEHHDHAVNSGRLAGENMTGAGKPFVNQSIFWSYLSPELGYEAVGIVDSSLPTVAVYLESPEISEDNAVVEKQGHKPGYIYHEEPSKDFQRGIVFYLKNDRVVGLVMWNIYDRVSIAKQVLKSNIELKDLREVAKHFNLTNYPVEYSV